MSKAADSCPMPNRVCLRCFAVCLVRHPARDSDRREGDAGAFDAQEVLGKGPTNQRPRPGGTSARRRSHHSSHVGLVMRVVVYAATAVKLSSVSTGFVLR